jgi:hypothetical protein
MILLVGTADEYLVEIAHTYSLSAILVTEDNWVQFINDSSDSLVGYTGVEEFINKDSFFSLLLAVNDVRYCPSNQSIWTTNKDTTLKVYLERALQEKIIAKSKILDKASISKILDKVSIIENKLETFLNLVDDRKTQLPQVWGVGCSMMYGMGVEDEQRYINLIASNLNKSMSLLAQPGTSVQWAADQILRSDIKKDDIIIWGLTNNNRLSYYDSDMQAISFINLMYYKKNPQFNNIIPKKILAHDEHWQYTTVMYIHQVIRVCELIGAKLLIVETGMNTFDNFLCLQNLPNYFYYTNKSFHSTFVDIGTDEYKHPGPLQHQLYADAIIEQLQKRNWI